MRAVRTWIFWMFCAVSVQAQGWVMLESDISGQTACTNQVVHLEGEKSLAGRLLTPASTFKIVIAWAGLESGRISPSTRILCRDKHVAGTPRELDLREALHTSSNDYFVETFRRIGREKFIGYVQQSGFSSRALPEDWLEKNPDRVSRAGEETVTARALHQWFERVCVEGLSKEERVNHQLKEALFWGELPGGIRLYGKTGTSDGAARFVCLAEKGPMRHVFSSLVTYAKPGEGLQARAQAVKRVEDRAAERLATPGTGIIPSSREN
ncbi:MAG: penicillin-binding transpeptidase domain-containing protein [Verrucomicrobiae bacterium]|nr:penicillin-binding transpeptidase domain-containing protein [Verrucomicrobiae bacterium]